MAVPPNNEKFIVFTIIIIRWPPAAGYCYYHATGLVRSSSRFAVKELYEYIIHYYYYFYYSDRKIVGGVCQT